MAVVWHGHYIKYFELARSALLQKFDYDYPQMRDSGFAWPIVDMRSKYVGPVRYGQKIKVRAKITEWEYRLKIEYLVPDAESGRHDPRLSPGGRTIKTNEGFLHPHPVGKTGNRHERKKAVGNLHFSCLVSRAP